MNRKKQLFFKKMELIFENISHKDLDKFTELFFNKNAKTSFANRKTYLKKWLKEPLYPRLFAKEYKEYPFFELRLDGKRLFVDADEFLSIDIESFTKIIKAYSRDKIVQNTNLKSFYRYIYLFNRHIDNNNHIDYFEIKYIKPLESGETEIEVTPPKSRISLNSKLYYGTLLKERDRIALHFKNDVDYISAIFNMNFEHRDLNYFVGVAIGITDTNQKIPVAKKVILSKNIIDTHNLYLILNETEIISTRENLYHLRAKEEYTLDTQMEKYSKKIHHQNKFFKSLTQKGFYNSFYHQLAFKEFSAISNIFQKISNQEPFYLNHRKRVLDILIKSYEYERYSSIYIVMPIESDNIFAYQSQKSIELQDSIYHLSQKVSIEFIFVTHHANQKLDYEFKLFLEKIKERVKISFVYKKEIEEVVNSVDFLFTDKLNFVVTKFLRVDNPVFNLFTDENTVIEHQSIYKRVQNRAIAYGE